MTFRASMSFAKGHGDVSTRVNEVVIGGAETIVVSFESATKDALTRYLSVIQDNLNYVRESVDADVRE